MAKKKKQDATSGKQVNFRASPQLFARMEAVCEALETELSSLIRQILIEKLPEWENRAEQAKQRRRPAD